MVEEAVILLYDCVFSRCCILYQTYTCEVVNWFHPLILGASFSHKSVRDSDAKTKSNSNGMSAMIRATRVVHPAISAISVIADHASFLVVIHI